MKNTIIVLLIVVVVFLFVALTRQAHRNSDLRRWNESLKSQVNDLKDKQIKTESNKASEVTVANAPEPQG